MRFKPTPFGKYHLLDRVNTGGMAEVFRAKAFGVEGFERIVAVKRILPSIAADTDFIRMFIDEAKLAVQLNHANIAQIFDLGKVDESYFIALEYVHGKDLRAVFDAVGARGKKLPVELSVYVVMKICEGLDYAHRKRDASGRELELVHRDVSPQNMLISFDGDVKLIDFGIAKAASKTSHTRTGILKGKFGYLSPEQVRGERIDQRSDIFGLGIVLHELLTGERLFVGDSDLSTIEKVRSVEIRSPRAINPAIPDALERVVMQALSRDKDARFQTALELHDALQGVLLESGRRGQPFGRKELRQFMLAQFPEDAARDPESTGDLAAAASLASQPDVTPIVAKAESSAVYKETRDVPEEANKTPSTILGMPAVLPPADLAAPSGRSSAAPPPPRRAGGTRPPPPPSSAAARSVPPPPPRTQPPAAPRATQQALPSPVAPSALPGQPALSVPPPPPPTGVSAAPQRGAGLSMDWDEEEELSTQIYDRPEDYENVDAGFDDLSASRAAEHAAHTPPPQQQPYPLSSTFGPHNAPQVARPGTNPPALPGSNPPARPGTNPPGGYPAQGYAEPGFTTPSQQSSPRALYSTAMGIGPNLAPSAGYEARASDSSQGFDPSQHQGGPSEQTPPPGVQIAAHAYRQSEPPPAAPAGSLRAPPAATETSLGYGNETPERRNPLYSALAVAAVAMLCFVGWLLLKGSEPGVVQLTTHPADAQLVFDGKQVGSASPFVITNVSAKERHVLEVHKPGYRSWSQEVEVQPGQTLQFPVTLQPTESKEQPAVAANAAAQGVGVFSLETSPPGARVSLDGQELEGATPMRVGNLLARSYEVKVKLPGFKEHSARVDVRPGVEQTLPRVMLEPERVRVRVTSEPANAEVAVLRDGERRSLGRAPVDVTVDNDDSSWVIAVRKSGYEDFEQPITIEDGSAELNLRAVLARKGGEGGEAVASSSVTSSEPRARAPEPSAEPKPTTTSFVDGSAAGQGTLRINARPWAQVVIDGRPVGNTPQMNIALPAGNHRVQLVNPEFNLKKNLTVTIKPGQIETQIIALQ